MLKKGQKLPRSQRRQAPAAGGQRRAIEPYGRFEQRDHDAVEQHQRQAEHARSDGHEQERGRRQARPDRYREDLGHEPRFLAGYPTNLTLTLPRLRGEGGVGSTFLKYFACPRSTTS